ncbi:MAG: DeoR/GlpR family DNA-binding transcription regulator [Lachnospiraceae bacterium]|nr:DeoR/GlpR family DNA-binding transcription regulator [Lachnospiraceae bacterium]
MDVAIFAEERKKLIVEYVNRHQKASVPELCVEFSVSPATIRNDLKELSEQGLITRVHGGVITNESVNYEPSTSEKQVRRIEAKSKIAEEAVKLIQEGDCIALDAGTTTMEIAKRLGAFSEVTVITYDLEIAHYLDRNTNATVIMAGGLVRKNFHYVIGDAAVLTIKDLNVDIAFMATNGVSVEKGVTTPKMETAKIKKTLIANAKNVVLVSDSEKIGGISFVNFADIEQVDVFITDADADERQVRGFEKMDVKVKLVEY